MCELIELNSFERTQQAQMFYRTLSHLLEENPGCKNMYELIYYKGNQSERIWIISYLLVKSISKYYPDQEINLADQIYNYVQNMQKRENK